MTELEFYKFIEENNIEYHWTNNEVFFFVDYHLVNDLHKILTPGIFDEEGLSCTMKDGYFAFDGIDICDYYGIKSENIFKNTR